MDFFTVSGNKIKFNMNDPLDFSDNSFGIIMTPNYFVIQIEDKIYFFKKELGQEIEIKAK